MHFKKTLLVGKAATLAMHLKGLSYVDDQSSLTYAAAELGIAGMELPEVLRKLEHIDFVTIKGPADNFRRVDIRIPAFRSGYEDLGELWNELEPSEVEQAAVQTLEQLLVLPMKEEHLNKLGLDSTYLSVMKDVMGSGQLIVPQTISGERFVYSPLAVDANPTAYLEWANFHSDDVAKLLNLLMNNQGLALSSPELTTNQALNDSILSGVIMPVVVNGATGERRFVFAPKGGLNPEDRIILDKARALLACVRYGQQFAASNPIRYPRAILRQLRDHKRFQKAHPDLFSQYALLTEKLIGRPVQEGTMWNFEIIDTPENLKALDVAIDMVEVGEAPATYINIEAQKAMLSSKGYKGPTSSRPRLAKEIHGSPETRADIVHKLSNLARGVIDE